MFQRRKVGLALSGGGERGIAHIGVLKVLERYNIPIDFIAGTSIGAVVGALYSAEPNAKKLEKEILSENINKLFDYTFPKYGLIKGDKISKFLEEKLKNITFKDLKIPLFVTSFDIEDNREVIFCRGDVAKAVRSSISIPGVFVPVENNSRILVDGGVVDPLPTEILRKRGAEIIIAVNVGFIKIKSLKCNEISATRKVDKKLPNIFETILRALQIMNSEISKADLLGGKADLIINIELDKLHVRPLDFRKVQEAIKIGERYTKKSLEKIEKLTAPHPFKTFLNEINRIDKNIKIGKIVKELKKV